MQRIAVTIVAFLVFIAGVAAAEQYIPAKGSFVRIEGTSSLHDWTMEGSTIEGSINAPPLNQWQDDASKVTVSIPVTSIKSEHAKMDKLMADALKAQKNPHVRYELVHAALTKNDKSFSVSTRGKLTIAGVTRNVEMQIAGVPEGNTYVLTGQLPIRMSDYGIKPPTAMLGTIRTGDDVRVSFRWVVEATR